MNNKTKRKMLAVVALDFSKDQIKMQLLESKRSANK